MERLSPYYFTSCDTSDYVEDFDDYEYLQGLYLDVLPCDDQVSEAFSDLYEVFDCRVTPCEIRPFETWLQSDNRKEK